MNQEQLYSLSRKELQSLAKQHNLKANLASKALVELLLPLLSAKSSVTSEEEELHESSPATVKETLPQEQQSLLEEIKVSPDEPLEFVVGADVEVDYQNEWQPAKIKRINKLSVRVCIGASELTVKFSEVRFPIKTLSVEEESGSSAQSSIEESESQRQVDSQEEQEEEQERENILNQSGEVSFDAAGEPENEDITETFPEDCEAEVLNEAEESFLQLDQYDEISSSKKSEMNDFGPFTDTDNASVEVHVPGSIAMMSIPSSSQDPPKKQLSWASTQKIPTPGSEPRRSLCFENDKTPSLVPVEQLNDPSEGVVENPPAAKNPFQSILEAKQARSMTPRKASTPSHIVRSKSVATTSKVNFEAASGTKRKASMGPSCTAVAAGAVNSVMKRKAPDFAKLHKKQFDNQKSITSLCERASEVTERMDKAYQQKVVNTVAKEELGDDDEAVHQRSETETHKRSRVSSPRHPHLVEKIAQTVNSIRDANNLTVHLNVTNRKGRRFTSSSSSFSSTSNGNALRNSDEEGNSLFRSVSDPLSSKAPSTTVQPPPPPMKAAATHSLKYPPRSSSVTPRETSVGIFKARGMPNFSSLHHKLPATREKVNTTTTPVLTEIDSETKIYGPSRVLSHEKKRQERRGNFCLNGKENRKEQIAAHRRATFTPNGASHLHKVSTLTASDFGSRSATPSLKKPASVMQPQQGGNRGFNNSLITPVMPSVPEHAPLRTISSKKPAVIRCGP